MLRLLHRQQDIDRELAVVLSDLPQVDELLSRHVRDLLRYVHAHLFDRTLNVAGARNECGLRDHNVSSLFQQEVGCSLKVYIDRWRMHAAQRLLQHPGFSVFEIGQSLGYEHPQTFYRIYRRYFGGSPARHRQLASGAVTRTALESRERTA